MRSLALLLLTVAVAHASVTVTRTSNDGPHPSTMEIAVALPDSNNNILIPLTRTDAFEDIPITLLNNGVSRTFSSRQVHHPSHSHYRNVDSKSVISVRHVNGKRQISGHVMHEGTSYFLEPVGESEHRVVKNVMNPAVVTSSLDSRRIDYLNKRMKRQTNASPTTYTVELHLLLDSTVWSLFSSLHATDAAASAELNFYYSHILNGIDVVYRNIGNLSISVTCIGITISKTHQDDKWMPDSSSGTSSVEGSEILGTLVSYIVGRSADHFMAFTRKDIRSNGSIAVVGVSSMASACHEKRVSAVEDNGLHSWASAAHELAHSLGASHDGLENDCKPSTKFVMSPEENFYDLTDVANSYRFSPCSVADIKLYLEMMGPSNCLLNRPARHMVVLSSPGREGTRLTLDQVCRYTFPHSPGKVHFPSETLSNPARVCAIIFCQSFGLQTLSAGDLRAPAGTPCGNRKSCNWNGQCTPDASAPAADEACLWGDTWSSFSCSNIKKYILRKKFKYACSRDAKLGCCRTLAGMKIKCNN